MEGVARRFFTRKERRLLLERQDFGCAMCGKAINLSGSQADHVIPFSYGGKTELSNGQALCIPCHSKKTESMQNAINLFSQLPAGFTPRGWQGSALQRFESYVNGLGSTVPYGFSGSVVQGAGKSVFNGMTATALFRAGLIDWAIILVPSSNLTTQTIRDCKKHLKIELTTMAAGKDMGVLKSKGGFVGEVMTYQYLFMNQESYKHAFMNKGERVLIVRDEVHQLADPEDREAGEAQAWGKAVQDVFGHCRYRISLSGTLFRSDKNRVHDIRYVKQKDGSYISDADYTYGMAEAIADGVIRRLKFHTADAEVRWLQADSTEVQVARLSDQELSQKDRRKAVRVATNPRLEFAQNLWRKANRNLLEDRRGFGPGRNSAGVVMVANKADGEAMQDFIEKETGTRPAFVYSDGTGGPNKVLDGFRENSDHWLVAIRKIGQGFSMERLRHVVLLSNIKTKNWFSQAACRANRLDKDAGEWAGFHGHVYIPAIPEFVEFALEIEREVAHVVSDEPKGPGGSGGSGPEGGTGTPAGFRHLDSRVSGETVIINGIEYPMDLIRKAEQIKHQHPDPSITVESIAEALRLAGMGDAGGRSSQSDDLPEWDDPKVPMVLRIEAARKEIHKRVTALAGLAYQDIPGAPRGKLPEIIYGAASQAGHVYNESDDLNGLKKKMDWLGNAAARLEELRSNPRVTEGAGVK